MFWRINSVVTMFRRRIHTGAKTWGYSLFAALAGLLFVMPTSSFASSGRRQISSQLIQSKPKSSRIVISDAELDPVHHKENPRAWSAGMFLGRPTRGTPNEGMIFKTNEMHVIVGNFPDDNKYSGNTVDVSTKSPEIFSAVEQLDQTKNYVFHFWRAYPLHFNMQSTYIMVDGVDEAVAPTDFVKTRFPSRVDIVNGKSGGFSGPAVASGRIIWVERRDTYMFNRPTCLFVLDQGGALRGNESTVANEKTFQVFSERACEYVESILPYGLDVKVTYTVPYLTVEPAVHFASSIEVDRIPGRD